MANRLVPFVTLVLATSAWVALRRRTPNPQEPQKVKPVPVQTWEGEGGALPATGSHLGPDPAVIPSSEAHEGDAVPTPLGP